MTSTYTPLGVELMVTGENAGTWGTKTNTNLNIIEQISGGYISQAIAGSGTTAFSKTDGGTGSVVATRVIEFTGALTGSRIVTFPVLTENFYLIKNTTTNAETLQLKAATGSGATVTWATDDKGWKLVYFDGVSTNTGVYDVGFGSGDVTLTGTQTLTNKTLTSPKIGTNILDTGGNELINITATGSAVNEFTIANAATGNAPTLSATGETNVGINIKPKGTGETIFGTGAAAATLTTSGTHDLVLDTNSGTNSGNITITDAANGAISLTPNGLGRVTLGAGSIQNLVEKATVSATAATGTINYDVITQAVLYYTSAAAGNFTLNIRGDGSNALNAIMATGQSISIVFAVTCTGTPYYNNVVQIDGSTVTPEWQGGAAPTAGNANSVDIYTYTIFKTGDATFTAFASQTQFA
jgi:hypothetical protein